MGLNHPTDLEAWQAAVASHEGTVRRIRGLARRRSVPTQAIVLTPGADADILVVVDAPTPSLRAAVVAPIAKMNPDRVAVLTTEDTHKHLPQFGAYPPIAIVDENDLARTVPNARSILAVGHYMQLGALAYAYSRVSGASFFVSQHGIVTPFAPPLPPGADLLAWSKSDADFWMSGRNDTNATTVGSELLWQAHRARTSTGPNRSPDDPGGLLYLGQLHGHELPRRAMAKAAVRFCRSNDALYRPHPSETDLVSRMQHRLWQSRGVKFEVSPAPLAQTDHRVVAVFSTGVLEAAAAGRASWVDYPEPPEWLDEVWNRYAMKRFGSATPTQVAVPDLEPAGHIAEIVTARAEGTR